MEWYYRVMGEAKVEEMGKHQQNQNDGTLTFLGKFIFLRGGKSKQGKGKNGKKGSGKKEGYDLIVHIDLQEWKLSDDMVIGRLVLWKLVLFFCNEAGTVTGDQSVTSIVTGTGLWPDWPKRVETL